MKKILKIIGYGFLVVVAVLLFQQHINAQVENQSCIITESDIRWSNIQRSRISENNPILEINTSQCKNIEFEITLRGEDYYCNLFSCDPYKVAVYHTQKGSTYKDFLVTAVQDKLKLSFKSDSDSCVSAHGGPFHLRTNCLISVQIKYNGNIIADTARRNSEGKATIFDTYKGVEAWFNQRLTWQKDGIILANCTSQLPFSSVACSTADWSLLGITGVSEEFGSAEVIDPLSPSYNPNSPCWHPTINNGYPGYDPDCYELLAPIAGIGDKNVVDSEGNLISSAITNISAFQLGEYIQTLFNVALGILMVLAVIMIIIAGVQYMTVESFYGKTDARQRITNAIGGLILALSIFLILETINPQLLEINFGKDIEVARLGIEHIQGGDGYANPGGTIEQIPADLMSTVPSPGKIYCPGTGGQEAIPEIARSFIGLSTYRFGAKGSPLEPGKTYQDKPSFVCENNIQCRTFCPENSFCVDCSGFVNHVLKCAGIRDTSLGNTEMIFRGVEPYSNYNPSTHTITDSTGSYQLQIGDLVGQNGHVAIYIGDGKIVESTSAQSGRLKNKNTQENTFEARRSTFITHVRKFGTF